MSLNSENYAKNVGKKVLEELNITNFTEDSVGVFLEVIEGRVVSLVYDDDEGKQIDRNLLDAYNEITNILLQHETDYNFLNNYFLN